MISYPEIQEKMHEEIDRVLGSRSATLLDKGTLPYTEAVIEEGMRYSPLSFLVNPHVASEDTKIGPYFCPKGTTVSLKKCSLFKFATTNTDERMYLL